MKTGIRKYRLNSLAGLALLILPLLYLLNKGTNLGGLDPHEHEIQNLLTYFLLIFFSYYNHTLFVPRLYLTKRYLRYVVAVMGCILAVTLIPQRIEQWTFLTPPTESTLTAWIAQLFWRENLFRSRPQEGEDHRPLHHGESGHQPFRGERPPVRPDREGAAVPLSTKFSIIFLLCTVSALMSISVQTANRMNQLEIDKLQAELGQLKAQIHPHFLFNTLNSIYALAIRKDDKTADTIVKLAEFMRYMTRDAGNNQVPLGKELAYIQNYLDLQQARLRNSVRVSYVVEGDTDGLQIAPLILFTFIENAFKHGVNPEEDSQIQISIVVKDNQLKLSVRNRKVSVRRPEADGGMGLPNTQARLDLLYPQRYQVLIDETPVSYQISLTLQLA